MDSRRPGRHRADPLAASWHPRPDSEDGAADRGSRRRFRRYGWGLYTIPVLLILTVVAGVRASEPAPDGATTPAGSTTSQRSEPVVTEERKTGEYESDLFPAELPPGAPIPKSGAGTFEVRPGSSKPVGSGELYRYTIEIESGVKLVEGNDSFGRLAQQTLADPRSWTNPRGGGISLQRVGPNGPKPDFRVTLVSQRTAREVCGYGNGLPYDSSCRIDDRVYISAARWVRGAVAFNGDIGTYRRYVVNHEVGHVFGNDHVPCPKQGAKAPVMMQQTFSVSNDVLHKLNDRVSQGTKIPANGIVCQPNAWPFPLGKHGN